MLTALIPLSVITGGPTMAVILIVTAPMSILRAFFLAGYTASVPILVGRSQLARANSIFEAIYLRIHHRSGHRRVPGGIDRSWPDPRHRRRLVRPLQPGPVVHATRPARRRAREQAARRYPRRHRIHRPAPRPAADDPLLGTRVITLAPLVAALTVHVIRDLGQNETILGLVLTAYGIGTVLGALLTAWTTRRAVAPMLLGGTLTTGILLTVVSRAEQIPVLLGAATIAGIAQSVVLVTYLTTRSNLSPDALLGRVGSTARTISLGLQPIGMLVGGALIDLTDGSTTLALMGVVLVGITLAFAPVGALRRATTAPSVPVTS